MNTRKNSNAKTAPGSRKAARALTAVVYGSGNVFADLELPYPEERLAKAQLAHQISQLITASKLSQTAAATLLGIDQPKVSALINGQLAGFSTDRLLRFINALGRDVTISIQPPKRSAIPSVRVVALTA